MSVNVNTNTNTVTVQDASQTITIVDNGKSNTVSIPQPLINVIEVATPGPAGPAGANGASINTSSLVTTSSFNAFTSSINAFTASYNTGSFSGSFIGNLTGTASWAQYVVNGSNTDTGSLLVTASVSSNTITFTKGNGSTFPITVNTGSGTTVDTSSFATTGSNTFRGNQTITGSVNITGSQIITGSLRVIDPNNGYNIASDVGWLLSGGQPSVNWGSRTLNDSGGNLTVDWTNKILIDDNSSTLDWANKTLINSTTSASIDWENKKLLQSDGSTTALNYNTDNIIEIIGNVIPGKPITNNTSSWSLGSPTAAWKDLYVSNGSVTFVSGSSQASIKLGNNNNIIFTGATVTLPTGSTVTTAATASYYGGSVVSSSFATTASFAQNVYAPSFITYTGGNQSNGATTLTNVHTASATMSIATIGFYEFELYTTYNSAATTVGIKYSLSGSNSFSYLATQVNYSTSGSDRASFMFNSWDGGGVASSSAATTGNTAYIYGHVNATSTGSIFLRQASEVGGQSVTTTNVTGYLRRLY
jgi:hypothetical protein